MKQIQSIQIWVSGQEQTGNWINAYIINDNLQDSATFYWAIFSSEADGIKLSEGNLSIAGQSYIDWNTATDINEDAYVWIADQLGLTLI